MKLKLENGVRNLLEVKSMDELEKEAVPEILYALCDFMKEAKGWNATSTQQIFLHREKSNTKPKGLIRIGLSILNIVTTVTAVTA